MLCFVFGFVFVFAFFVSTKISEKQIKVQLSKHQTTAPRQPSKPPASLPPAKQTSSVANIPPSQDVKKIEPKPLQLPQILPTSATIYHCLTKVDISSGWREFIVDRPISEIPQGIRFGYVVKFNRLDSSRPHTFYTRDYWRNPDNNKEWLRWVDDSDEIYNIPVGATTFRREFIINFVGIPGWTVGEKKTEVWLDRKLVETKYYRTVSRSNIH